MVKYTIRINIPATFPFHLVKVVQFTMVMHTTVTSRGVMLN